jgi:hypothetical protein
LTAKPGQMLDTVVKVIGLLAVIFGLFKYFSDIEIARHIEAQKQALKYVEQYGATQLQGHRQELFRFWLKHSDVVEFIAKHGASRDAYRSFFFTALGQEKSPTDLVNTLYDINNFYDQVVFCRSSSVCDQEIIDAYFCKDAAIFAKTYDPILESLGEMSGVAEMGRGAKELAKPCAP